MATITSGDIEGELEPIELTRGVTGHRAEEAFVQFHQEHGRPVAGSLTDCRQDQCGYDFQILRSAEDFAVEVKGLAGGTGGVSLTDKEWRVAKERKEHYILAIVRNVYRSPEFDFIHNPYSVITPTLRTYSVIRLDWSVTHSELTSALLRADK